MQNFDSTQLTQDRSYYIQYYTQKLQTMSMERQIESIKQLEQFLQSNPHFMHQILSELGQIYGVGGTPVVSTLLVSPPLKCMKQLLVVMGTIVATQSNPEISSLIHNEMGLLTFMANTYSTNETFLKMIQTIHQLMQHVANTEGREGTTKIYQMVERYFEPILFPELTETYINDHVRPSTNHVTSDADSRTFVFFLFEFVDAVFTILKIYKA